VTRTGAEIVVRALEDEGVALAFGIPGTHNIELYDALAASDRVRVVLVTDEQSASFAADGAWRASGRLACANLVPGAGLTHALSGVAEAFMDNVPMLVLGCGIRRDTGRAYQLHDVDQQALAAPVTKGTFLPTAGPDLYGAVREACRLARTGAPGPVFVEVPADLYLFRHDVEPRGDVAVGTGEEAEGWAGLPEGTGPVDEAAVERVVELVRAARRPLLYVGAGAAGATGEVRALAERLQAPVSTTFQGKGVFPETHTLFLWPGFGNAAPPFARRVAGWCDLTLAVGCRFSEVGTGSYGLEPPGPLVHVDIDSDVPGRNFPADVAVTADAGAFLRMLLERLEAERVRKEADEELLEEMREGHREVWEEWMDDVGRGRVTPAHLLRSAQDVYGPDTVFTTDSGNGTFLAVEVLRLERPGKLLAPVDYSCMGYAVPAAVGAKLARPDCPVVALAGDGAFLMTGLETLTAAEEGLGIVILVLRDRELGQISQFQSTAMNRKVASTLPDYDLEGFARGVGAAYMTVHGDDEVVDGLEAAGKIAARGRPVLVGVEIDYSRRTWFTRGVVKTNLLRLPLADRVRFVGRAVTRRFTG
jgi:acetolactate synthase-1/2/3 large subunit